jgi:hypothetical protein
MSRIPCHPNCCFSRTVCRGASHHHQPVPALGQTSEQAVCNQCTMPHLQPVPAALLPHWLPKSCTTPSKVHHDIQHANSSSVGQYKGQCDPKHGCHKCVCPSLPSWQHAMYVHCCKPNPSNTWISRMTLTGPSSNRRSCRATPRRPCKAY